MKKKLLVFLRFTPWATFNQFQSVHDSFIWTSKHCKYILIKNVLKFFVLVVSIFGWILLIILLIVFGCLSDETNDLDCFFFAFTFRLLKVTESVNGKNLTMFSFEGDFRTRPSVSLGGASKKVKTKTLLYSERKIIGNVLILYKKCIYLS